MNDNWTPMAGDPAFIVERRYDGIVASIRRVMVLRVLKTRVVVAGRSEFARKIRLDGEPFYPALDESNCELVALGSVKANQARDEMGL